MIKIRENGEFMTFDLVLSIFKGLAGFTVLFFLGYFLVKQIIDMSEK
jgi:hypothetical protein